MSNRDYSEPPLEPLSLDETYDLEEFLLRARVGASMSTNTLQALRRVIRWTRSHIAYLERLER